MDLRALLGNTLKRQLMLLEALHTKGERTSEELMAELDCSLPVLLNDIRFIAQELPAFAIEKHKGFYHLKLAEQTDFGQVYRWALAQSPECQILEVLLYEHCENIAELAKQLFLSFSKTQRALKRVEQELQKLMIQLHYRPLRLGGSEPVIRHLYYRYFQERQLGLPHLFSELEARDITLFVDQFLEQNDFRYQRIFVERARLSFVISMWRIKRGHRIAPKRRTFQLPEGKTWTNCSQALQARLGLKLSERKAQDALWLHYHDELIFSADHLEQALTDPIYHRRFQWHRQLIDCFDQLLQTPLSRTERERLTVLLQNASFLYPASCPPLDVLRRPRQDFLAVVAQMDLQAVTSTYQMIAAFLADSGWHPDFGELYTYLLLSGTSEVLLRLKQQTSSQILLVSDLTPTVEFFLLEQIQRLIYGRYQLLIQSHYQESDLSQLVIDAVITTGPDTHLGVPTLVIDPALSPATIAKLQQLVNHLSNHKN